MKTAVLVIGATSFIGSSIIKKLLENDYAVKCLVRTDSNKEKLKKTSEEANKELEYVTGNLNSSDSIFHSFKNVDTIIYLIDLKHTDFIKNFLKAIAKSPVKRVVFISSTTVLVPQKNPVRETKLASESLIKNSGLDFTILRPTMIYGCSDDRNYSRMLNFIKKWGFFVMFGKGNNLIQPVYIEDVADAVMTVLFNPATFKKIYEISGREPVKYREMLQIVRSKLSKPFRIIRLPLKFSKWAITLFSKIFPGSSLKPDMIERMEVDKAYSYDQAFEDFGFSPISFEQGIEYLIKSLKI